MYQYIPNICTVRPRSVGNYQGKNMDVFKYSQRQGSSKQRKKSNYQKGKFSPETFNRNSRVILTLYFKM